MLLCSSCPYFLEASCYLSIVIVVGLSDSFFRGPIFFYNSTNLTALAHTVMLFQENL